ncbi:MAG: Rieske 2Fe-2S domain-containing protein [Candidatus Kapabacteria bacterium]|nr:Rieske 2Fe-2S domain-containing protein [Candidatus Kapabacteria bacterium]
MASCNRREFLVEMAASAGIILSSGALAALLASCESDTTKPSTGQTVEFDVSTAPALATVGGIVKQTFGTNNGGMPVFIVRTGETSFVVLSSRCSHQGCEVNLPTQSGGRLVCPCHLAEFDPSTGAQTRAPSGSGPTGPLQRFAAVYDAQRNTLTITF